MDTTTDPTPSPSSAPLAKLAQKIATVMAAVERVPKRGHNALQNYDYVTEADVLDAIRAELAKVQVVILPSVLSVDAWEIPRQGRDPIRVQRVWVEFLFIDGESGATLTRRFVGDGMDAGDKGIYKAMTGAEKYAITKSFMVSAGDDPEVATPAADPQPGPPRISRAAVAPSAPKATPAKPSNVEQALRVDATAALKAAALDPKKVPLIGSFLRSKLAVPSLADLDATRLDEARALIPEAIVWIRTTTLGDAKVVG